ncbi:amidase [Sansalvadorimonas sp. 2012CJ34-2]|uniref:Amidase n=1 Tax=Parendozoicomonas callyspongiae TaxID=2942213 RepID=A0ABT0PH11_9GAMM|nr:amidase [Sansalvadorimonas sp. 2012CJ34-2]MCL6270610.1 amidase [Sansalvadorimonas sp. 2012CJ34-2]
MELQKYDATGLAELIRRGKVSNAEVYDFFCHHIETLNPSLNAVIRPRFDKARDELKQIPPNAPFAGVPFLTKDLIASLEGEVMGCGSAAMQQWKAPFDSELVHRFRRAGLVILGQTNTPEMGLMGITEPVVHGPTHNPWNLERTPGGSSGGSAAAVAAGMVPMASGGDGGGSIRIPASCCGLFGLKPSRNRQPIGPAFAECWAGAVSEHVLTRSVRDSAAMLEITNGMDSGAPSPVLRETGYVAAAQKDPEALRVGFSTRSPTGSSVDPECVEAVEKTAYLLEDLGHRVEEIELPLDSVQLATSFLTMLLGQTAKSVAELSELLNIPARQLQIELPTRALYQIGSTIKAKDYLLALNYWNELSREMGHLHQRYDVIMTPTMATPPQPIGALYPSKGELFSMRLLSIPGMSWLAMKLGLAEKMAMDMLDKLPFTQAANMTGQPSMSVPLHWSQENLPVGVQFTGAMGEEMLLFSLAGQLERTSPWHDYQPDLSKIY